MKYWYCMKTDMGPIRILCEDSVILRVDFIDQIPEDAIREKTELIDRAVCQMEEYLVGERKQFDLPLAPQGTLFQKKVWEALLTIPYGTTKSYGEIATMIGNPKASRAVGGANNKNPISIIIPCHRVIGTNGSLVGYGGGLDKKTKLLHLEQGGK
ncbi:methylated-DNA--[protein]-cysteine S-methyltransferase [Clostridium sp. E02]|uniref:methylated-DNA--[protein]-cysteine S-methyltransferase n=1 Tax=Clostridium sp. E02 TaxID=2487134 RepID=UPI000F540F3A|nr:methylated-DNA--[protein]-cysteine S-methyltransferase [Clostridium sp. E02]